VDSFGVDPDWQAGSPSSPQHVRIQSKDRGMRDHCRKLQEKCSGSDFAEPTPKMQAGVGMFIRLATHQIAVILVSCETAEIVAQSWE
jgi:hypothetical protein